MGMESSSCQVSDDTQACRSVEKVRRNYLFSSFLGEDDEPFAAIPAQNSAKHRSYYENLEHVRDFPPDPG